MPVHVSGKIAFDAGDKTNPYSIQCPQLGIDVAGSGVIEDDIETLRKKINRKIREEFGKEPQTIQLDSYSLGMKFTVEGPVNKTLGQFEGGKGKDEGEEDDGEDDNADD